MNYLASDFRIRQAVKADELVIGALINGIQRNEFGLSITLADQPDLSDIDDVYIRPGGTFIVSESLDGEIVGTIALLKFRPDSGCIRKFFVSKNWRGPTGIAMPLLNSLFDFARANQINQLTLGTTSVMDAAHQFYRKNGFAEIQESELPPGFPRIVIDNKFFRRQL